MEKKFGGKLEWVKTGLYSHTQDILSSLHDMLSGSSNVSEYPGYTHVQSFIKNYKNFPGEFQNLSAQLFIKNSFSTEFASKLSDLRKNFETELKSVKEFIDEYNSKPLLNYLKTMADIIIFSLLKMEEKIKKEESNEESCENSTEYSSYIMKPEEYMQINNESPKTLQYIFSITFAVKSFCVCQSGIFADLLKKLPQEKELYYLEEFLNIWKDFLLSAIAINEEFQVLNDIMAKALEKQAVITPNFEFWSLLIHVFKNSFLNPIIKKLEEKYGELFTSEMKNQESHGMNIRQNSGVGIPRMIIKEHLNCLKGIFQTFFYLLNDGHLAITAEAHNGRLTQEATEFRDFLNESISSSYKKRENEMDIDKWENIIEMDREVIEFIFPPLISKFLKSKIYVFLDSKVVEDIEKLMADHQEIQSKKEEEKTFEKEEIKMIENEDIKETPKDLIDAIWNRIGKYKKNYNKKQCEEFTVYLYKIHTDLATLFLKCQKEIRKFNDSLGKEKAYQGKVYDSESYGELLEDLQINKHQNHLQ